MSSSAEVGADAASRWPAGAARSYRLGDVVVDPPVPMAPMADVTDVLFHEILRDVGGPGMYTAEMVSSAALARPSGGRRGSPRHNL